MRQVLIIDDFEPFLNAARRVVERLGYAVLSSSDGRQGLEVFFKENPAIVITDFQMPHLDGLEVLTAVKQKSPETDVVVLTGFANEALERQLMAAGAFACLKKPLNLEKIVQVIGQIQDKRETSWEDRPSVLVRVDTELSRELIERVLRAQGCETRAPGPLAEGRWSTESGGLDLLFWEVRPDQESALRRVMEMTSAYGGYEVILLDSGDETKTLIQEAVRTTPSECLSKPLSETTVLAAFQNAHQRLLRRRSALYKRVRALSVETVSLSVHPRNGLVVDLRGVGRNVPLGLKALVESLPLPWVLVDGSWNLLHASPLIRTLAGPAPTKLDRALWDALSRKGFALPSLEEVYSDIAQRLHGDGAVTASPAGVVVVSVAVLPSPLSSHGLAAVFFPTMASPSGREPSQPISQGASSFVNERR